MIRCHLARLMGEHKMRISDVIRETGLSRNTVTLMYKETAQKVNLEALDKLCALFDCDIHEILEREPHVDPAHLNQIKIPVPPDEKEQKLLTGKMQLVKSVKEARENG